MLSPFQIPIVGMPYELIKTGSVRHSAPGSVAQFLAISAAKRGVHAWLGSAGGKYFTTHIVEIAIEESLNLRNVLGKQPPRMPPSALAPAGMFLIHVRNTRELLSKNMTSNLAV